MISYALLLSLVVAAIVAEPTTYKGVPCTIPFVYRGKTYHNCVTQDDTKMWCATGPKNYVSGSGKWAYCCPQSCSCDLDCSQLGGFKMDQHCKLCECKMKNPCDGVDCGDADCVVENKKAICTCAEPQHFKFDSTTKKCVVKNILPSSKIMAGQSKDMKANLHNLISGLGGNWKKCFTASENSFSSRAFHKACDGKGPTITILQIGNRIVGGYTDRDWTTITSYGRHDYSSSHKSFIFSVNNNLKMPIKQNSMGYRWAIMNYIELGPTFGFGNDIRIYNQCNVNLNSYSYLGYSYQLPSGYTMHTQHAYSLMTGTYSFKCTEYEVYYQ